MQDFFLKDGQKLDPKTLEIKELTEQDKAIVAGAIDSLKTIASILKKNKIAETPFFYLFFLDMMLDYAFSGKLGMVYGYLAIIKEIKASRKKQFKTYIMSQYKNTENRRKILEALEKI